MESGSGIDLVYVHIIMKRKSAISAIDSASRSNEEAEIYNDQEDSIIEEEEHFYDDDANGDDDNNSETALKEISTFRPSADNTVELEENHGVVFGLMKGQTIACQGQYKLSVLKGAINLLGGTIHANPKKYHVYALPTHSIPLIECIQVENLDIVEETVIPGTEHLFDKYRAILRFEPLYSGLESIGNVAPVFKNLCTVRSDATRLNTAYYNSFQTLIYGTESTMPFYPNKSWIEFGYKLLAFMDDSESSPITMVTGPKSSGKSSFCRVLNNFLNSKLLAESGESTTGGIYYLELDPGQPEYGIPGTLSLHKTSYNFGLPYTHTSNEFSSTVVKAHSLGDVSPKDQPDVYLSFANDLFRVYKMETAASHQMPLIVNTPGWARGLGLDLSVQIATEIKPSHVVYLGTQEGYEMMRSVVDESLPSVALFTGLEIWRNQQIWHNVSKYSSPDLRTLQTLCYFHDQKFNRHLTEIPPYSVYYGTDSSIKGFYIQQNDGISPEDFALCFNGTVVHIVKVDDNVHIKSDPFDLPRLNNPNDALLPETSQCLGYGIVQSIDTESERIQLLTPMNVSNLSSSSLILVRGRLQVPLWILWNHQGPQTQYKTSPYLSKTGSVIGAGSEKRKVRRNIQRGVKT